MNAADFKPKFFVFGQDFYESRTGRFSLRQFYSVERKDWVDFRNCTQYTEPPGSISDNDHMFVMAYDAEGWTQEVLYPEKWVETVEDPGGPFGDTYTIAWKSLPEEP